MLISKNVIMNRIDELFAKNKKIVSIYFPAGYPNIDSMVDNIIMLEKKGVDIIEIGIPFSDPLADGPVIQLAAKQALDQGMNLELLFSQLENIRQRVSIPLVLMGYWNVIWKYGVDKFLDKCKHVGIDGVIFPDLPLDEYIANYKNAYAEYDIKNILLICPETKYARMKKIVDAAEGFVYIVSSSAITGGSLVQSEERDNYFDKISSLKVNKLIGFGITNKENMNEVNKFADGGIIGTAFIKALESNNAEAFIDSIMA